MENEKPFKLVSKYRPTGDQPEAIDQLVKGLENGVKEQVLMGVTGSGKTFTMANVIEQMNRPTLVLAHNKTLAAQLCSEFREFFPENAVEYFVSYYDYYQPEAYIPTTDTYIEKDSAINDEIDKLRHSATSALSERRDVIIVASVSCIYSLGDPIDYRSMVISLRPGMTKKRDDVIHKLVEIQYERNDINFVRNKFRVRGDVIEIFPSYSNDTAYRIEFFGDEIDRISEVNPLTGDVKGILQHVAIYPASHYVVSQEKMEAAIADIYQEMERCVKAFEAEGKLLEAQRIRQRTEYDIEMLRETGFCKGIENYSRVMSGRPAGSAPFTLLDYFPKDFLLFVDESHVTLPQVRGMYGGDRSRKESLINFGFRLLACIQITDAGAHQNADAERIFILHGNAGICKRFFCCRNGILGESSHSSCRLEIHAFFCHEAFDLACQMYFIFCCIKFRNRSDSAGSLADAVPEFLHGISNRGYRTQPCDDYSSLHSNSPFLRSPCRRRSESPVR